MAKIILILTATGLLVYLLWEDDWPPVDLQPPTIQVGGVETTRISSKPKSQNPFFAKPRTSNQRRSMQPPESSDDELQHQITTANAGYIDVGPLTEEGPRMDDPPLKPPPGSKLAPSWQSGAGFVRSEALQSILGDLKLSDVQLRQVLWETSCQRNAPVSDEDRLVRLGTTLRHALGFTNFTVPILRALLRLDPDEYAKKPRSTDG
jgi:hypothetical protein